ncbi:hypothetical protein NQ314_009779 [Rhamnusium bicolor]|uniref:Uncharacterized protein n=1 Tax=Rhamnusium bicolor TaxID=1586634 RepID=A0AAV8XYM9_9CUCU|nr:hypothetical protein NQ314_009779 [Rhamnusium bicolor]
MYAIFAFFAALAATNAGIVAPSARIIQGPSSRSTIVGPDGSVVSSVSPGGQIITEEHPGLTAYTAPVVATAPVVTSYAAPAIVAHSAPVVSAYATPVVSTYSAPVLSAYAAPAVTSAVLSHKSLDTVIAGPSGTIATSKTVSTPAVVAAPSLYAYGVHGLYL